ncbi:SixA phosphatase family protein [Terrimonas pollutisoli]|uniref:SixA phosphatase family protein n=1 Tax=Terrimonas pollutisoli TaxID=3034147 RepID=UPI0023EBFB84|nr:histidine phosphatase family protein [Terrimonas sp. H1YJ31]
MRNLSLLLLFFSLSSCTRYFYVVRHAEKAVVNSGDSMMSSDPGLIEKGQQRAEALKTELANKKIGYIFSTNTIRTKSTAEPTRVLFNLTVETYPPFPDSAFFDRLQSLKKNTLIVGHSNTVDDIVNRLCGAVKLPTDLADTEYDNLYIVKKTGRNFRFEQKKYGIPSTPNQ